MLPLGVIVANAQDATLQSRYVVQPGDTLDSVAAEFGVDAAAILAASAIENPPALVPAEIIVIPDPGESPEAAAWNASQQEGTSPFVSGARDVAPGETLASIAGATVSIPGRLPPSTVGRYRYPACRPAAPHSGDRRSCRPYCEEDHSFGSDRASRRHRGIVGRTGYLGRRGAVSPEAVGGFDAGWEEPTSGPVFAADVLAYQQMYSLLRIRRRIYRHLRVRLGNPGIGVH